MAAGEPTVTPIATSSARQAGGRRRKQYHSAPGEDPVVKSEMVTLGETEWGSYDNMTQSQADYACKFISHVSFFDRSS